MIQLTLRRALRDLGQHLTIMLVVVLSSLLVVVAPALLVQLVDDGAREAVEIAGPRADVLVHAGIGDPNGYTPTSNPEELITISDGALDNLPRALQSVARDALPSITSPLLEVAGRAAGDELNVRVGMLSKTLEQRLELVDGSLPDSDGVVITRATAESAGLAIGDTLEVAGAALEIVGIVEPPDSAVAEEWPWQDTPGLLQPSRPSYTTGRLGLDITVLTSPEGIASAQAAVGGEWDGLVRIRLDPSEFTNALQADVIAELTGLEREGSAVSGQTFATVRVTSGFIQTLDSFSAQARAAVAQMSMIVAGATSVAVLALVLVGRLLVLRRERELELERARGASLASVGLRSLAESGVVALVGGAIGVWVALWVAPGDWIPALAVIAVAALAPAVQSTLIARESWNGRRTPANRTARARTVRQSRKRRLVLEATILALAVGALFAARSRGLLQARSEGDDPLLAFAPAIVGVAVGILVLRATPVVVRVLARLVSRSRGALGTLAAAQAQRSVSVLPLLALTLAFGLGIGGALLLDTVRSGQVDASWQRVGADARLDGPVDPAETEAVQGAPGVEQAAAFLARPRTELTFGDDRSTATLLALDGDYAALAARLPGAHDTAALAELPASGGALPALVGPASTAAPGDELTMQIGTQQLELVVVGRYDDGPNGYLDGPFLYVDYDSLLERLDFAIAPTSILAVGSGAGDALAALDRGELTTRADWLAERSGLALVAGVERLMTAATVAIALFALTALLASVFTGTRQRARSLALLRTLGLRARLAWLLVLAELAPVVVAALVGGVATAIVISTVIGPVLGLESLTGGIGAPTPSISPLVIAVGAGAAVLLLLLATLAEYLAHRRDRLSEILRVGG